MNSKTDKYLILSKKQFSEGYVVRNPETFSIVRYSFQKISENADGTVTVLNPTYVESLFGSNQ
jgi:hypothetical protein